MCLKSVDRKALFHHFPLMDEDIGYKVFIKSGDGFIGAYRGTICFEFNEQYTAYPTLVVAEDRVDAYYSGFHYFPKLEDAKKLYRMFTNYPTVSKGYDDFYTICKVKMKKVLVEGQENYGQVRVAQYMTLLEEIPNENL